MFLPIAANHHAGTGTEICARFGMQCETKMLNNAGCLYHDSPRSCGLRWDDCSATCEDANGITEHYFDCIVLCYP